MYQFTKGCHQNLSGSGVYLFYHNNLLLYVGQTNDFRKRIYQHYYAAIIKEANFPFYSYLKEHKDEITFEIIQEENRLSKERELIKTLKPKFNQTNSVDNDYLRGNQRTIIICLDNSYNEIVGNRKAMRVSLERAARLLKGEVAFKLYLYLLCHNNHEQIIFSPKDFAANYCVSIDRARKVFPQLIDAGYLVEIDEGSYIFYETPIMMPAEAAEMAFV